MNNGTVYFEEFSIVAVIESIEKWFQVGNAFDDGQNLWGIDDSLLEGDSIQGNHGCDHCIEDAGAERKQLRPIEHSLSHSD